MPDVELEAAVAGLNAQRALLGDSAVDAAIAALRSQRASPAPAAERKHLTVMFADLSGFTSVSEREDPETVRELVNDFFMRMGDVVEQFGGYIDKFIGDELMVLFGAPVAMEDHASRALHAAAAMLGALDRFNAETAGIRGGHVSMHFGINSGTVVAGEVGTAGRRQYTVMGDAVNVAARLRTRATAGEILVGGETRRLVGPGFQFDSIGQLAMDGRDGPVDVYRLVHADARAASAREARDSPMFGRARELAVLEEAFREVAGRCHSRLVAIIGDAGIGKTRLLTEFRSWLRNEAPPEVLLRGNALPHMQGTPYFVAGEVVRHFIGVHESDSPEEVRTRLGAALAPLELDRPHTIGALLALMGHEPEIDALRELSPPARKALILAECAEVMKSIASAGPAVVVFEDTHWADDLSMELLRHLAGTLADSPILFITLARPSADEHDDAGGAEGAFPRHRSRRLVLSELDDEAARELVLALAPQLTARPDAVRAVVTRGQGNPFFVQSILGSLIDRGLLSGDGVAIPADAEVTVPPTISGVLAERIDHLPPAEKHVLQAASIVGRVFWEGLVRELAGEDGQAPFETLRARGLIDSRGHQPLVGDREWAFRHVLLQEVAYNGLLRERRRAGHQAAATWLEGRCGARRDEYAMLLAHHYSQAEDWAGAAECFELAGNRALGIDANMEAREAYAHALGALGHLDSSVDVQRRVIDVTLGLGRAAFYAPYENVGAALRRAGELAEQLGDVERGFRIKTSVATYLYMTGREQEAVTVAFECLAVAANRPELEPLLSVPYHVVALAMFVLGNYGNCIAMLERAREIEANHPENAWIYGRSGLDGVAQTFMGNLEAGNAILDAAAVKVRDWGVPAEIANVHLFTASAHMVTGRYDDQSDRLREAVSLGAAGDNRTTQYLADGMLGHWLEQQGDLAAARDHFELAMSLAAQLESVMFVPLLEAYFALLELREGDITRAMERAGHAVAFAQETHQMGCEAEARRIAAWCLHFAPGQQEAAREEFQRSIDLHRRTGANALLARALFDASACFAALGDATEAAKARGEAAGLAATYGLSWLPVPPPAAGPARDAAVPAASN